MSTPYARQRYWYLHELRRLRASERIGTQSTLNAQKERKALRLELVKLRRGGT